MNDIVRNMEQRMREELDLAGMALFVRIVEDGSLSAAGRSLGLPKATVSRRLALLESSIGTPLLARSSRALCLTDAGRRLFERAQPVVHEAEAIQYDIKAASAEPAGMLRVTVPVMFESILTPGLMRFLAQHPRIRTDLHFSDEPVNVIADGFDLAICMGDLADSELIGYRLAELHMVIVAAPAWLAAHGYPEGIDDLRHHTAILTSRQDDRWSLAGQDVRVPWRVSAGNMTVAREAVRAGLGLARLLAFFVARDLADGVLVRVLPHVEPPGLCLTALYPRTVVPSRALRALLDALPGWFDPCG